MFLSVTTSLSCNNNHNSRVTIIAISFTKLHNYRPHFWQDNMFCATPESLTFCKSSDHYCKFTVCNQPITVHPPLYLSSSCIIFTRTHTQNSNTQKARYALVFTWTTLCRTLHTEYEFSPTDNANATNRRTEGVPHVYIQPHSLQWESQ